MYVYICTLRIFKIYIFKTTPDPTRTCAITPNRGSGVGITSGSAPGVVTSGSLCPRQVGFPVTGYCNWRFGRWCRGVT